MKCTGSGRGFSCADSTRVLEDWTLPEVARTFHCELITKGIREPAGCTSRAEMRPEAGVRLTHGTGCQRRQANHRRGPRSQPPECSEGCIGSHGQQVWLW